MPDDILEKVLDFIQKYLKYLDRELLRKYIKEHERYGTFDYAMDETGEIIAICRWNIKDDVADILDFAIKEGWRRRGVGKDFIMRGLQRFKDAKVLRFKRGTRGDERMRSIRIDKVLERNIL